MKTSDNGIRFIKGHEGFRAHAYQCPAGVWTIGYGHTGGVKSGDVVTEAQGEAYLRADLATAEKAVNAQNLTLTQNMFDALVSFTFNVGAGNFERSSLLRFAKNGVWDTRIYGEFSRWVYGGGAVLPGLVKRRKAEALLYFKRT